MQQKAMALFRQRQSREPVQYAPIAKSLAQLDVHSLTMLKKKFDIAYIAYFILKEKLANHLRFFFNMKGSIIAKKIGGVKRLDKVRLHLVNLCFVWTTLNP